MFIQTWNIAFKLGPLIYMVIFTEWNASKEKLKKLVFSLRYIIYEERLKKRGLTTLQESRERGDMIEVIKL